MLANVIGEARREIVRAVVVQRDADLRQEIKIASETILDTRYDVGRGVAVVVDILEGLIRQLVEREIERSVELEILRDEFATDSGDVEATSVVDVNVVSAHVEASADGKIERLFLD